MTGRTIHIVLLLAIAMTLHVLAEASESPTAHDWDSDVLDMFARLPVQDGGRIKPLDTYASFTLLQLHGRRNCRNLAGERISATEWLLDAIFFPETARHYPLFRVENSEVISSIGLQPKKKRDHYSYAALQPARERLIMMGRQFANKDSRQRTPVERELISLAMNLRVYETVASYADFARARFDVSGSERVRELFPDQEALHLSDILRNSARILAVYMDIHRNADEPDPELKALQQIIKQIEDATSSATALAIFPPPAASDSLEWLTPADLAVSAFSGTPVMTSQVSLLAGFETLVHSINHPETFKAQASHFIEAVISVARSRKEYERIPLEVVYYRLNLFHRALVLYLIGFLVVACTWMRPHNRLLGIGAFAAISLPTCLLVIGIVMRSIIRNRPPVTSAYETILFVTMIAVMTALFIEWANRKGLAISMGAILGVAGMFFANKYEAGHGVDTMPALVAVLDTNFWLALHVTTIAIGYGAGFFASGLAHVFIFGNVIGFRRHDPTFYRDLTRMVYGALCFSFVFICLGTVLGGIWANESWGRFWGWDPKENGALMICLWQLTIMHARLDGMLKNYGINIAAIIGGIIIAFCWFGVNMLGVGLHSYGFTSGGYAALLNFYLIQTAVVMLGCVVWFRNRNREAKLM